MVISLAGEWDIYRRPELAQLLEPAAAAPRVVLDLTAAKYVTSTLMAALVVMHKTREVNGLPPAVLAVQSAFVTRLLTVACLDELFPIVPSVEAGLAASSPRASAGV